MGKRNTYTGYLRVHGSGDRAARDQISMGVVPSVMAIDIDPAAAVGSLVGKSLPAGAIPLSIDSDDNGVTAATAPLISIGLNFRGSETDDTDALVATITPAAKARVDLSHADAGALLGRELAEDADITAGDDGSTVTSTGTVKAYITYTFADDGKTAS